MDFNLFKNLLMIELFGYCKKLISINTFFIYVKLQNNGSFSQQS